MKRRNLRSPEALRLLILVALCASPVAFASDTKKNIKACKAELAETSETVLPGAEVIFKGVQGGVKQRIKFIVKTDERRETIVCRARRGKVQEIDWGRLATP